MRTLGTNAQVEHLANEEQDWQRSRWHLADHLEVQESAQPEHLVEVPVRFEVGSILPQTEMSKTCAHVSRGQREKLTNERVDSRLFEFEGGLDVVDFAQERRQIFLGYHAAAVLRRLVLLASERGDPADQQKDGCTNAPLALLLRFTTAKTTPPHVRRSP